MRQLCFYALACLCFVPSSFAQMKWFSWMASEGSVGEAIGTDKRGYIYVTGYFSGTANFGDEVRTSEGGADVFVAKMHPLGRVEWLKAIGSLGDDMSSLLSVAEDGTLFLAGNVATNAVFYDGSTIESGPFLAKLNSNGNVLWARGVESPPQHLSYSDRGKHVWTASLSGQSVVTTSFGETGQEESRSMLAIPTNFSWASAVTLDAKQRPAITGDSDYNFVQRVAMGDGLGGWKWVSTGIDCDAAAIRPMAIIVSRQGEVLTTGSTPLVYAGSAYDSLFVTRHSKNGKYVSGETAGEHRGQYRGLAMALDRRGKPCEAGYAQDYYFSTNSRFAALIRGPGFEYRFKSKFYSPFSQNYARGICVDEKNRVYAVGDFENYVGVGTNFVGNGARCAFVVRIDDLARR